MIDHLDDLEADFLRFYRIEDLYQLDGPRFFRLAWRVSAYGGVMQMRSEQAQAPSSSAASPAMSPAAPAGARREVSADLFTAMFPADVERVTVPEGAPDG